MALQKSVQFYAGSALYNSIVDKTAQAFANNLLCRGLLKLLRGRILHPIKLSEYLAQVKRGEIKAEGYRKLFEATWHQLNGLQSRIRANAQQPVNFDNFTMDHFCTAFPSVAPAQHLDSVASTHLESSVLTLLAVYDANVPRAHEIPLDIKYHAYTDTSRILFYELEPKVLFDCFTEIFRLIASAFHRRCTL